MRRGPEPFHAPCGLRREAARFARIALELCSGFVALLPTAKLNCGKTRTDLFADNPRFATKIVLLDRIQWFAGHLIYKGKNQGELPGCDT